MRGSSDTINSYLSEIGKVPLLTAAEEIELGNAVKIWMTWDDGPDAAPPSVQRRGRRAKKRMMEANLRLVVTVAKKYREPGKRLGMDLMDIVQEGSIGLSRAVEKFDPARGYKFSTYSYWWVRQAITRSLQQATGGTRLIRLPGSASALLYRVERARQEARNQGKAEPSTQELAKAVQMTEPKMVEMLELISRAWTVSGDQEACEDGTPLLELVADPQSTVKIVPDVDLLEDALGQLEERDRYVVEKRFFEDISRTEVGKALGITRQRVEQIENNVLNRLRVFLAPMRSQLDVEAA